MRNLYYASLAASLLWNPILSADNRLSADPSWDTRIATQGRLHTISGGIQQGANLFHSFRAFSIATGEMADFQTSSETQHIISRVTGGQESWLNGTLRVSGSDADLYLLNPQGILLGEQASLDMRGSLHLSTADQLILQDNTRIATGAGSDVQLSVAPPEAFGFLTTQVAPIQITGAHLTLREGQRISLTGGNLTLSQNTRIQADAGQIQLAAVRNAGVVDLDDKHQVAQYADIHLTDTALVVSNHSHSQQTGTITLHADQVRIVRSTMDSYNHSAMHAQNAGLLIDATDIQLLQSSTVTTTTTGAGQAGAIHLHASGNILLATGAELHAMTHGAGPGGTVHLQADQQVWLQDGDIWAATTSAQTGAGQGGDVRINAANIHLSHGGQIWARTEGTGNSGAVQLQATQQIQLQGRDASQQEASGITVSTISTQPQAGAGGHVELNAANILITDSAGILAETWGEGTGGSVTLQASEQIIITGTDPTGYRSSGIIVNSSGQMARAGASGTLLLRAREIHIRGDAGILASTSSSGAGASVTLAATERILLRGSQIPGNQLHGITVSTESPGAAAGAGGNLCLDAANIRLEQNSQLLAKTAGGGRGGSIYLHATEQLELIGSVLYASAEHDMANGSAGDIRLTGRHILLDDGSMLASDSRSTQTAAGNIELLLAQDTIDLRGNSRLTTTAHNASGGSITLQARERIWLQDSQISTSVQGGTGRGGNIAIDPIFILLENSQLQANAYGGPGGNIHLQADYLLTSGPVQIEASSALSTAGNIQIQAITPDGANLVTTQSIVPLNVQHWQLPSCREQTGGRISRLVMAGYDAHPTPVDDILSALPVWLLPLSQY
ncbi:MAG: filamentous hemagglutinin N-terminal domain-containing protein [Pseudomonadota bacterium]